MFFSTRGSLGISLFFDCSISINLSRSNLTWLLSSWIFDSYYEAFKDLRVVFLKGSLRSERIAGYRVFPLTDIAYIIEKTIPLIKGIPNIQEKTLFYFVLLVGHK